MTIEDIANFCEFKDCEVSLGDPVVGFIQIDGTGVKRPNNFQRYLSFHELSALASPKKVLGKASTFKVQRGNEVQAFNRKEFKRELEAFQQKVGIE
ncbi:hypothetical protein MYX75_05485 [Acidobacteria bacterium AH-259-A15]|nr:hypothetical protein [Acidobacteria bacterium AH-259-A15]